MRRRRSGSIFVAALIVSLTVSTTAFAGGAGPGSAQSLVRSSLLASIAQGAVHTDGGITVRGNGSASGIGFAAWTKLYFHGDLDTTAAFPLVHLKGFALNHHYKLVSASNQAALKVGQGKWSCSPLSAGAPTSTAFNPAILGNPRAILKALTRYKHVVNLGPAVYRGVLVWHVRAHVLLDIPLAQLAGLVSPASTSSSASIPRQLWVHVTANFWISQADNTLRKFDTNVRVKIRSDTVRFGIWDRLSMYGRHVPISLPPACAHP